MRKMLSLIMSLVIFLSCFSSAFADVDFKLRNGIMFGDTMEDILAKETTLTRNSETSNSFTGKIAGYPDAECTFVFDDDGKLVSMNYFFGLEICTDRDEMDRVYKTIYQSLKRQYGNPLGNTGGSVHLITGPAFLNMAAVVVFLGDLEGYSADYSDYDEWVVDVDDYHVKIDLVSFYFRDDDYNYSYMVDVSYKMYTDEDYAAAVQEQHGEQEEVDNDF